MTLASRNLDPAFLGWVEENLMPYRPRLRLADANPSDRCRPEIDVVCSWNSSGEDTKRLRSVNTGECSVAVAIKFVAMVAGEIDESLRFLVESVVPRRCLVASRSDSFIDRDRS